jgi:hypothetical protein
MECVEIFLIMPVFQSKKKNKTLGVAKGLKDLTAEPGVVGRSHGRAPFQLLSDVFQYIALNIPDLFLERGMNEKKVVRDGVASEEYVVEGLFSGRRVGEGDVVCIVVKGAVHDQTIRNVFAQEVLERQVHAEHVFAQAAAGPGIADAIRGDDELVPSGKEPVPFRERFIAVSAAQVGAGDRDKIVHLFVGFAMQLDFLNHDGHYSKLTWIFKRKNGAHCNNLVLSVRHSRRQGCATYFS